MPVTLIVPGHELILSATSFDISRGGMRVSTTTDLPAGQPVVLRFTLPGSDHELLVRGRVVLSFYDASNKVFAHGIAFTQYTTQDYENIGNYVTSIETPKPK